MKNLSPSQLRVFMTLLFIGSFANMDKSLIGLSVTAIADDFNLTASQTGLIMSIFYVSFIAVTLPGGWIIDRFGYRKFVLTSLAILTVGSVLFGSVSGFLLIVLVRLLVGFGQAGYTNGSPKIIATNFPAAIRGDIQSKVVATAGVGGVLAYTLGAYFVQSNWRVAYYVLGGLFFVAFLFMYFFVPEPVLTPEEVEAKRNAPKVKITDAWKNRNTVVLALALLFNNLVAVATINWMPSVFGTLRDGEWDTPTVINGMMIGNSIVMALAVAVAGSLVTKRFAGREKMFMLVNSVLSAVFILGLIYAPNLPFKLVALYLTTASLMFAFTSMLTLPYRLIPIRMIASAFAVINIGAFVGGIFQGTLVGTLTDAFDGSYAPAFMVLAGCSVLAGLVPYLLREPAPADAEPRLTASAGA